MSILDQRAETGADRLWLVTNADGSMVITDEANKNKRGGFAPAWSQTYRQVLADFMQSLNKGEASRLALYAALQRGIHDVDGVFSGKVRGAYFIANGTAYKAIDGLHHKGRFVGFGGRRYRITLDSGDLIESNNVWFISVIPPHLREILKDNASMEPME